MAHIQQGNRIMAGSAIMASVVDAGNTWQLASGHWVPRKFDAVIAHPRPDSETTTAEHCRNAYTGVAWNTRVLVFGGAYPFRFELVTGPSGMTIGEKLVVSGDVLVEPANYGKLEWSNPTAGDHTVTVRVYDQDYNRGGSPTSYAEVTWTLTVGMSNWVFIDPVGGSNANAGTLAAPFADTTPFVTGSTYAGKCVYVRTGTMNLVGMSGSSYACNGNQPKVFIGYPGETATINMNAGGFTATSAGLCLKDLTLKHDAVSYGASQKIMLVQVGAHRSLMLQCAITRYTLGTASSGNGAVFSSTGTTAFKNYLCFAYNDLTGNQGPGWHVYTTNYSVIHGNVWHDVVTTGGFDGSTQGLIFFKACNANSSVRQNQIWDNITGTGENRLMGFKSAGEPPSAWGLQNVEWCYNTFYKTGYSGRDATWREGDNNTADDPIDNYHFYRNSFGNSNNVECIGTAVLTNSTRGYNVDTGALEVDSGITDANNLESVAYFDASMALTGAYRVSYLGTHGAEVV